MAKSKVCLCVAKYFMQQSTNFGMQSSSPLLLRQAANSAIAAHSWKGWSGFIVYQGVMWHSGFARGSLTSATLLIDLAIHHPRSYTSVRPPQLLIFLCQRQRLFLWFSGYFCWHLPWNEWTLVVSDFSTQAKFGSKRSYPKCWPIKNTTSSEKSGCTRRIKFWKISVFR